MSDIPEHLYYTEEHEYVGETDAESVFVVGITDYAQGELGDIVYVELPRVGTHFDRMEVFGVIEAVKAVSDLYCPIAGEVVEINEAIDLDPALVNGDPYGDGWMIKLRAEDDDALEGLMSPEDYESHIDG